MIAGKSVLAIIPARQGSKRCPDKNITLFRANGQYLPLIQHAINHAQASKYIDNIIISSDSDAILNYAKPPLIALRQPPHLSSDQARMEAVIVHALYAQIQLADMPLPAHDLVILLQPTSPYRTAQDIDQALELSTAQTEPRRIISTNPARQRNGALYIVPTHAFLATLSLEPSQPFVMPDHRSLDIDLPQDFLQQVTT